MKNDLKLNIVDAFTVYGKKSILSKESDTKLLQSIYFAYEVGIASSCSNRIVETYGVI